MNLLDWAEIALFVLVALLGARPMGRVLERLADTRQPMFVPVRSRTRASRSSIHRVQAKVRPDKF
jgi:uncharacterized membrane protein